MEGQVNIGTFAGKIVSSIYFDVEGTGAIRVWIDNIEFGIVKFDNATGTEGIKVNREISASIVLERLSGSPNVLSVGILTE